MATDLLVWNTAKDRPITLRQVIVDDESWPAPSPTPPDEPDPSQRIPESEFVKGGKVVFKQVMDPLIEKFKKQYMSE